MDGPLPCHAGEWNTMKEGLSRNTRASSAANPKALVGISESKPVPLKDISVERDSRILIGNKEVERILGGGIVPGSMILLGGSQA